MKDDVMRILWSQSLEIIIGRLRRILSKKEHQLDEIQKTCKHEVVVFTGEERCYGAYDDNLYQKCLFCGSESASRRSFMPSLVIDVSDFEMGLYNKDKKFDIVKSLYIKTANANTDSSTKEIVSLVQKDLDSQNEEYQKMMDNIHEKIKMKNSKK